jgi:hypothetical protein
MDWHLAGNRRPGEFKIPFTFRIASDFLQMLDEMNIMGIEYLSLYLELLLCD